MIVQPDASLDEIDPSEFDVLALPGGRGPEQLRVDQRCMAIVRHFLEEDKPVTGLCHSSQIIAEGLYALGIKGKRLMGIDEVRPDVIAAGQCWVYSPGQAMTDGNIVTAWRRPDHEVWMRSFMALLEKRGIIPGRETALLPRKRNGCSSSSSLKVSARLAAALLARVPVATTKSTDAGHGMDVKVAARGALQHEPSFTIGADRSVTGQFEPNAATATSRCNNWAQTAARGHS